MTSSNNFLLPLRKKFKRNKEFRSKYQKTIHKYITKRHATKTASRKESTRKFIKYILDHEMTNAIKAKKFTLRKRCPYSEFLWSELYSQSKPPYSIRMRENTDQRNSKHGNFSRSARIVFHAGKT